MISEGKRGSQMAGGPPLCVTGTALGSSLFSGASKMGYSLTPPPGYLGHDFDWADYLKQSGAEAAPQHCFPSEQCDHDFKVSMKLEAVDPLSPEHIHVVTVTRVQGPLIWLRLEGLKQSVPELITHQPGQKQRKVAVVQPAEYRCLTRPSLSEALKQQTNSQSENAGSGNGKYTCPKIYFNHRCFSGPYLNKGRIAELPQCVGPGNCVLVLKEVLMLLINSV
ncbi:hypothetical protein GJAV_G00173900 [Gymnothorax javanicus]|nr:hypothetical protein GJAV_G00173900 [Gymnothorax javanicus]